MSTARPISRRCSLAEVRVAEAMHEGVLACSPSTPLSVLVQLMAAEQVHCIVVADDGVSPSSLWGVVSDLDLVAAASVRDLDEQTAGGSSATPVLTVGPQETLQRASQLMTEHATAHLVVVEPASGRAVGMLSTLDLARVLAEQGRARRDSRVDLTRALTSRMDPVTPSRGAP